ncbi:MAG: hypothetical protein E7E73_04435 [Negativicoccus succinicivorans]|uniref:hypothetical protein n=1 Tax=Negativicoccus succinicivorans TaxID=620903 RepID=UPI0029031736|nr:hypothetical protein [Negativicoccus succinicivorans]MDU2095925.1 hypothetical protein [Negativicoccus succinicivorans]MDU2417129.1 hypothetical protein [Negativicoccus succinicivorans]
MRKSRNIFAVDDILIWWLCLSTIQCGEFFEQKNTLMLILFSAEFARAKKDLRNQSKVFLFMHRHELRQYAWTIEPPL